MDKQEMQQRLESIEAEAKAIRKALQKKEQWEPKGGEWLVGLLGVCCRQVAEQKEWTKFGVMYPTKAQAQKAAKAFRQYHRLYAYVAEHAPDWEPDWSGNSKPLKYFVDYNHTTDQWSRGSTMYYEGIRVYMPEHVAEELARKLNSGEVVL